jgi:hypothetical protein
MPRVGLEPTRSYPQRFLRPSDFAGFGVFTGLSSGYPPRISDKTDASDTTSVTELSLEAGRPRRDPWVLRPFPKTIRGGADMAASDWPVEGTDSIDQKMSWLPTSRQGPGPFDEGGLVNRATRISRSPTRASPRSRASTGIWSASTPLGSGSGQKRPMRRANLGARATDRPPAKARQAVPGTASLAFCNQRSGVPETWRPTPVAQFPVSAVDLLTRADVAANWTLAYRLPIRVKFFLGTPGGPSPGESGCPSGSVEA